MRGSLEPGREILTLGELLKLNFLQTFPGQESSFDECNHSDGGFYDRDHAAGVVCFQPSDQPEPEATKTTPPSLSSDSGKNSNFCLDEC